MDEVTEADTIAESTSLSSAISITLVLENVMSKDSVKKVVSVFQEAKRPFTGANALKNGSM